MGNIISDIADISNLKFVKLRKGWPAKIDKALLLSDGVTTLLRLENGTYTVVGKHHTPNGNWAIMGYGASEPEGSVLDGLASMGVLTRAQVKEHRAKMKERRDTRERKRQVRQLQSLCTDLKLPLPAGINEDDLV